MSDLPDTKTLDLELAGCRIAPTPTPLPPPVPVDSPGNILVLLALVGAMMFFRVRR